MAGDSSADKPAKKAPAKQADADASNDAPPVRRVAKKTTSAEQDPTAKTTAAKKAAAKKTAAKKTPVKRALPKQAAGQQLDADALQHILGSAGTSSPQTTPPAAPAAETPELSSPPTAAPVPHDAGPLDAEPAPAPIARRSGRKLPSRGERTRSPKLGAGFEDEVESLDAAKQRREATGRTTANERSARTARRSIAPAAPPVYDEGIDSPAAGADDADPAPVASLAAVQPKAAAIDLEPERHGEAEPAPPAPPIELDPEPEVEPVIEPEPIPPAPLAEPDPVVDAAIPDPPAPVVAEAVVPEALVPQPVPVSELPSELRDRPTSAPEVTFDEQVLAAAAAAEEAVDATGTDSPAELAPEFDASEPVIAHSIAAEPEPAGTPVAPADAASVTAAKPSNHASPWSRVALPFATLGLGLAIGFVAGSHSSQDAAPDVQTLQPTVSIMPPEESTTTVAPTTAAPAGADTTVTPTTTAAPTTTTSTSTSTTTTAAPTPDAIASLSGSDARQSAPFTLPSGSIKLHYDSTGGAFTVRLLQSSSAGVGDAYLCTDSCNKDVTVSVDGGEYYLDVDSRGGSWNVRIDR